MMIKRNYISRGEKEEKGSLHHNCFAKNILLFLCSFIIENTRSLRNNIENEVFSSLILDLHSF